MVANEQTSSPIERITAKKAGPGFRKSFTSDTLSSDGRLMVSQADLSKAYSQDAFTSSDISYV